MSTLGTRVPRLWPFGISIDGSLILNSDKVAYWEVCDPDRRLRPIGKPLWMLLCPADL
jgi:hypothetical protein